MSVARRIARRLLLGIVAGVLTVGLAEVALRVLDLGTRGSIAQLYVADDRLGWRHVTDAEVPQVDREFDVTWHLDARGLRRAAPLGDGPRVLALGDSHTAGHGVETHETWASRLEARLAARHDGATVLNAGVSGYGAAQQWLVLEQALAGEPLAGVVVASYLGNDLRELFEGTGIAGFRRPLLGGDLVLQNPARPVSAATSTRLEGIKAWLADHSRLYVVLGDAVRDGPLQDVLASLGLMDARHEGPPHPRDLCGGCFGQLLWAQERLTNDEALVARAVDLHARLLTRMAEACAARDVPFLVALLPTRAELDGLDDATRTAAAQLGVQGDPVAQIDAWRTALLAALPDDVPLVDLTDALRAASPDGDPLYFPFDWHLTPRGQRVVAEAIDEIVAGAGWF